MVSGAPIQTGAEGARPDRPTPWIIGFVALVFLLTTPGQLTNVDSRVYFAQAHAIWLSASLEVDPEAVDAPRLGRAGWAVDRRGTVRGIYPLGTALALGPGILLGRAARFATGWRKAEVIVSSAWLCLLLGVGCWLLAWALAGWGASRRVALAGALAVFLGDAGIWFVRGHIWSENVTVPALALALFLAARWRSRPSRPRALALGAVLGALPWIHGSLWPVGGALCLVFGIEGMRSRRDGWLVWVGGLLPAALLVAYNSILFGAPLSGGYAAVAAEWIRARPGVLAILFGLVRFHWPAVLGFAGLVMWLRREDGRAAAIAPLAAVACHLIIIAIWRTEQENQLQRFMIVESMLLAPALGVLLARLELRGRLWLELPVALLACAGVVSMLFDKMFIAHPDVAGTTVTLPRVWWVAMGARSGAVGWVLGALVFAGAAACGLMLWRRSDKGRVTMCDPVAAARGDAAAPESPEAGSQGGAGR